MKIRSLALSPLFFLPLLVGTFSETALANNGKTVQPTTKNLFTGSAANRGEIRLKAKRVYLSQLNRIVLVPYLKWNRVPATCERWNGSAFVTENLSFNLVFYPSGETTTGIKNGRFSMTRLYQGQEVLKVNLKFFRNQARGQIIRGSAPDGRVYQDNSGEYSLHNCRYPTLNINLARSK